MMRTMFKGKIHRATITQANLHYQGSITIDEDLIERAGLIPNEQVQVVNINNGARFETYVIPGPRGSGVIGLNGAAARLGVVGDLIIIISYGLFTESEIRDLQPAIVLVDEHNRPIA